MQEEDTEQRDDAATHASKSHDKRMNDKRDDARRIAEQLIAEETRDAPNLAVRTYLVAVVIGLIIWVAIYFIWQHF
jgi:vacuolar-type H+-ATPase subunit H